MPTANWLTPQPAGYSQPEPEPRGLLSFLGGGQDLGAEISDRGGVIAQILMNLGGNRGGAGIAEATAAANERSSARREKRKAERMVNRAADKIEGSNPEMAAMMRANTAFGMQMIGKQYESDWSAKNREAELRQEYALKGELETANLQETARITQEQQDKDPFWQLVNSRLGKDGGGTAPMPVPEPAPGISDAGDIPAPTGLAAGTGTEPAPTNIPLPGNVDTSGQPISAQPDLQQPATTPAPATTGQSPAAVEQLDVSRIHAPLAPLSTNPTIAAYQEAISPLVGVQRIDEGDVSAILLSRNKAGVDPTSVIQAIKAKHDANDKWYREQALTDWRAKQTAGVTEQAKIDEEARAAAAPQGRMDEFIRSLAPTSDSRGPMSRGQKQPFELGGSDRRDTSILRAAKLSDQQIMGLPNAGLAAETYLQAKGAGGAQPATALAGMQTDITKAQTAQSVADEAKRGGQIVAQQIQAMKDTLGRDPRTGQPGTRQQQMMAELDSIAADKPENAAKHFSDFNTQFGKEAHDLAQEANAAGTLAVAQSAEQRQIDAANTEKQKVLEAADAADLSSLTMAFNAQADLEQVIGLLNDTNNNEIIHGVGGWIESFEPGSARSRIESYLTSVESVLLSGAILNMKKQSATGATGMGATNETEVEALKTTVANAKKALQNGEDAEYAIKKVYNSFGNTIMPDGGQRMNLHKPGFGLEDFNMKAHNPALFTIQQRKNTKKVGDSIIRPNQ